MPLPSGLAVALHIAGASRVHVRIETSLGTIEADIDSVRAPRTAANFLAYVDAGAALRIR